MRVNLRGSDILMSEQFLNGANVVIVFKQMCRKAVPEGMASGVFIDTGAFERVFDCFLNRRFGRVMPSDNAVFARR